MSKAQPPPEWVNRAACARQDVDTFYPAKGGTTRPAKTVCAACPVRRQCAQHALARPERFGIWGGLSESDRRKILRQRRQNREAA